MNIQFNSIQFISIQFSHNNSCLKVDYVLYGNNMNSAPLFYSVCVSGLTRSIKHIVVVGLHQLKLKLKLRGPE